MNKKGTVSLPVQYVGEAGFSQPASLLVAMHVTEFTPTSLNPSVQANVAKLPCASPLPLVVVPFPGVKTSPVHLVAAKAGQGHVAQGNVLGPSKKMAMCLCWPTL